MNAIERMEVVFREIVVERFCINVKFEGRFGRIYDIIQNSSFYLPPLDKLKEGHEEFDLRKGTKHFVTFHKNSSNPKILKLDNVDLSSYWEFTYLHNEWKALLNTTNSQDYSSELSNICTKYQYFNCLTDYSIEDIMNNLKDPNLTGDFKKFVPTLLTTFYKKHHNIRRCKNQNCFEISPDDDAQEYCSSLCGTDYNIFKYY